MRKLLTIPVVALLVAAAGCDSTTAPADRDLAGTWVSSNFAPATVRMTVSEIALEVNGAGTWRKPQESHPFAVRGAHVEGQLSLLFDFEALPDLGFEGKFTDDDTITGALVGSAGGFLNEPITFVRLEED